QLSRDKDLRVDAKPVLCTDKQVIQSKAKTLSPLYFSLPVCHSPSTLACLPLMEPQKNDDRGEVLYTSKITAVIKTGYKVAGLTFGKARTEVNLDGKDVFEEFWGKTGSRNTAFDQRPAASEAMRDALCKVRSETRNHRALMSDKTQSRVKIVLKYGVAISEINPFAKAAFSIARVTFELLEKQQKYDEILSDLGDRLRRVLPFAEQILQDGVHDDTIALQKVIDEMYLLTIDVAEFAWRTLKGMTSHEDMVKISDLRERLGKLVEDFSRAMDVEILKTVRLGEEHDLLNRLEPVKTTHSLDRCCMPGTRQALLTDIIEWALESPKNDSKARGEAVYWLYGIPGIGKTSMANSICSKLHAKKRLGGVFFCRRDDLYLSDPKCILPTLMFKLAGMWGPYRKLLAEELRTDPHLNRDSAGYGLFSKLLGRLMDHPTDPLVFVIDALDECGNSQTRKAILTSLFDACSRAKWLKIIITSRQEKDIEVSFQRLDQIGPYIAQDLAADNEASDGIRKFVTKKLKNVADRHYLGTDWPGPEMVEKIVARSGGLFIFVDTLWRLLKDDFHPDRCLAHALTESYGNVLAGLYRLYSTTIASRIGQNQGEFRLIMGTIIAVGYHRPLCDKSVADLIGVDIRMVKMLVDKLNVLLYRDTEADGGIRVRHLSVIEFLTGSDCPLEMGIDVKKIHRLVGLSCLNIMNRQLRFNICDLESSYISNKYITDLKDRIDKNLSDVLQYSCVYWSNHICYSPDTMEVQTYEALEIFFNNPNILYWTEALSLMGKIPVGELALQRVLSWTQSPDRSLVEILNDALRFLVTFRTPIMMSAPHIYLSGLPFMPSGSRLWNNMAPKFKGLIVVQLGRMKSWPGRPEKWIGHTKWVICVACSPDSRRIVSGSLDNTMRIWDIETGVAVGEPLRGHADHIRSVAYSPSGRCIVSGSFDHSIRIWDAETGNSNFSPLEGHTGTVNSVAYSPDGHHIVSGSYDNTIRIWDADMGSLIGEPLIGHTGWVNRVAYSPNGRYIISGSFDKTIRIWDTMASNAVIHILEGHTDWVKSVSYSNDGRYILSGSWDNTVRVWDAEKGVEIGDPLRGHTGTITTAIYSPDDLHIASGSSDNTIRIWDSKKRALICDPLAKHTDWVNGLVYSPNGRYLFSASDDNSVRIWDAKTGDAIGEPTNGHVGLVSSVAYSPDGRYIASASFDTTIRIWDSKTGESIGKPLCGHTEMVTSMSYSPDGRYIISGSSDSTLRLWDVERRTSIGEPWKGHEGSVFSVVYSPNGRHIASGSDDSTVRIWDTERDIPFEKLMKGHKEFVYVVTYSPDGRYVASGSRDRSIRIWDTVTGTLVGDPLRGHTSLVTSLAYSPNGCYIASGSLDKTIRIWDTTTGSVVGEALVGHTGPIEHIAYSPNGQQIVSGSWDKTIRIWDVEGRKVLCEPLKGHENLISCVTYSPNGQYILSGSYDQTIRVWVAPGQVNEFSAGKGLGPSHDAIPLSFPLRDILPLQDFTSAALNDRIRQDDDYTLLFDSNGWIRHPDGHLLFWVPEGFRHRLMCPAVLTIPISGHHRAVRVELSEYCNGNTWNKIQEANG
ncbi:16257_t:CDS:10, partial [Acaulospora colombiana]